MWTNFSSENRTCNYRGNSIKSNCTTMHCSYSITISQTSMYPRPRLSRINDGSRSCPILSRAVCFSPAREGTPSAPVAARPSTVLETDSSQQASVEASPAGLGTAASRPSVALEHASAAHPALDVYPAGMGSSSLQPALDGVNCRVFPR